MLVLASKYVGKECFRFLVESGYKIDLLIAANSDDTELFSIAGNSTRCELYSADIVEELCSGEIHYSWILNLWSPHILSNAFLAIADKRLNIHPAYVPWCKGNDNAAWVIRENSCAGVSLLEMSSDIDAAGVWSQELLKFEFPVTGKQLHSELQDKCIDVFKRYWPKIESGEIKPALQQPGGSYHTRKQTNIDRIVNDDKMMTAHQWTRWVMAHDFWPGTTAEIIIKGKKYGLKLELFPIEDKEEN